DVAEIRFLVCRKARSFWERSEDLSAHRLPKHFNAPHDRSRGSAWPAQYLSRFKGTAFPDVISCAFHRAKNLFREVRAAGLAEGFSQIAGFRGMTAIQEEPKEVRGVGETCHHDLRLKRIHLKKGFRHTYQGCR